MPPLIFIISLALLTLIELFYFKIANRFNIVDKPNERSSHSKITIRGGGVVFVAAVILFFFSEKFALPYFTLGLVSIAFISFLDDILTLNNKLRLLVHLLAVLLLFIQLQLFSLNWYWILPALFFSVGTINAYNFMDGINGITGTYSLITIVTLGYINYNQIPFINQNLLILCALSLGVFLFFNFRTKAKCFAGDVGSVSMAFIIIYAIGLLVIKTQNGAYILFLLLYGVDTATTLVFRKIRGENIFKAHRSHFYQFLTHHYQWSHLSVAVLYALAQLGINLFLLFILIKSANVWLFFGIFMLGFIGLRFILEGKKKLLSDNR